MDIITKPIDKLEELMGHSPHPAIVTVPLGAFTVSNVADALYMVTGNEALDDAAHVSMAVGLVGAAAAAITGLRDYGFIPKERQPNHDIATTHAIGNAVVSSLFMASFAMRTRSRAAGERVGVVPRLLGLAGGALSVYTGWLGGKLVSELGESVKPVMERQEAKEKDQARRTQLASEEPRRGEEIPLGPQETRSQSTESIGRRNGGGTARKGR